MWANIDRDSWSHGTAFSNTVGDSLSLLQLRLWVSKLFGNVADGVSVTAVYLCQLHALC